jgi:hypothetical protein
MKVTINPYESTNTNEQIGEMQTQLKELQLETIPAMAAQISTL